MRAIIPKVSHREPSGGRRIARLAACVVLILALSHCTTDSTRRAYLEQLRPSLARPSNPVVILTGFGHSRLFDPITGRYVWGTLPAMMHKRFAEDVDLPTRADGSVGTDRLVPRGFAGLKTPLNTAWALENALTRYGGYDASQIYTFPYDWRLSATENARRLGEFFDQVRVERGDSALRFDVVAHSAGGFIVLAYLAFGGASLDVSASEWDRASNSARERIRRVVLVAAPEEGSNEAFRLLVRGEKIARRKVSPLVIAVFPSITELLPSQGRVLVDSSGAILDFDLWDPTTWSGIDGTVFDDSSASPALRETFEQSILRARMFRALLRERTSQPGPEILRIAGDCVPTIRRVLRRDDGSLAFYYKELRASEVALGPQLFEPGDGSVPATTAGPAKAFFCDGHLGIATDPNVHRTILRFLLEPDTNPSK